MHYAARSPVERSTAPSYLTGDVQTGRVTLRAFLVAQPNGSYEVMPGALVRVSVGDATINQPVIEGRKDAWVLSERPVKLVSLLSPTNKRIELRRSGAELPSRVADNFFWLGRMAERAEGAARLWRAMLSRLADESDTPHLEELPVLVHCLADQGQIEPGFAVEGFAISFPHSKNRCHRRSLMKAKSVACDSTSCRFTASLRLCAIDFRSIAGDSSIASNANFAYPNSAVVRSMSAMCSPISIN